MGVSRKSLSVRLLCAFFVVFAFAGSTHFTRAQNVQLVLNADQGDVTISRHIYGHFAEHLGRAIYDGFWTKDKSGRWYMRQDVIDALRKIQIPNIRWPGGCFADTYHWKDAVGPQAQRKSVLNVHWGRVEEDNSFGTHEFMELAEKLGADAYIAGNVGSGTVQEMADWVEYLTYDGNTPMAQWRKQNGREKPWKVPFWGVGNESWGCGGDMRPEYYADLFRNYASYLRDFSGNHLYVVASGANVADYRWTEVLMREAGRFMDGISLHHYTVVGTWGKKGSATDFTEEEWFTGLRKAYFMDELITRHDAIMDQYDPRQRVGLMVDEWGMWHDPEPGTDPGFLYQQNTLRDAMVASLTLDIFNRHADRVKMANIAQTVNVLQAMILTKGEQMILTPTYHVFDMYKVHQDATLLPLSIASEKYTRGNESLPVISSSASRDKEGRIHITLSNLDPNQARDLRIDLRGTQVRQVTGRILTASKMNAHNTFEQPHAVEPATFTGARIEGQTLTLRAPAKSIIALELK